MPSLSVHDLGTYLREQRESARLSVRQLSELAGVSNPYLSQIERGIKRPSAEILAQLAKGLRISAESLYVRAGILEEREDQLPFENAVRADAGLSERQKRVLLDIYTSFRAENDRPATESVPPAARQTTDSSGTTDGPTSVKVAVPRAARKTAARATKRVAKTTQQSAAAARKTAVRTVRTVNPIKED
ncbi:MAG: helix-turn-helix domain-containing protein [Actinomycetales bacterium]